MDGSVNTNKPDEIENLINHVSMLEQRILVLEKNNKTMNTQLIRVLNKLDKLNFPWIAPTPKSKEGEEV